jgi:large subunit ribosomal protein L25
MPDFQITAEERISTGRRPNKRLRAEGRVPANLYGAGKGNRNLSLPENELVQLMEDEGFFSSLLTLNGINEDQEVLVREVQMHPYKPKPIHVDMQRIKADEMLTVEVPLHLMNEEQAPGVLQGGTLSQLINEIQVVCLPRNIPDHLEVDVGAMDIGDTLFLSDITAPPGVEIPYDEDSDQGVANITGAAAAEGAEEGEEAG